ncbi:DUF6069 family protein [Streptomyces sp. NPDC006296]|uniref:DUF6069 family protein n=1 Tax=Streptomyces sp. NPDC006296 TaxID=3156746 RepID=UPI0033B5C5E8
MSALRSRPAVVGLAALAPALVWLIADPVLGHRLRMVDGDQTLDIGLVAAVFVGLLASLAGWALLAVLERFVLRRARVLWTVAAVVVLLLSFLPLTGDGMDGGTRAALALMHLSVAAVLIPGLPRRNPAAPAPATS